MSYLNKSKRFLSRESKSRMCIYQSRTEKNLLSQAKRISESHLCGEECLERPEIVAWIKQLECLNSGNGSVIKLKNELVTNFNHILELMDGFESIPTTQETVEKEDAGDNEDDSSSDSTVFEIPNIASSNINQSFATFDSDLITNKNFKTITTVSSLDSGFSQNLNVIPETQPNNYDIFGNEIVSLNNSNSSKPNVFSILKTPSINFPIKKPACGNIARRQNKLPPFRDITNIMVDSNSAVSENSVIPETQYSNNMNNFDNDIEKDTLLDNQNSTQKSLEMFTESSSQISSAHYCLKETVESLESIKNSSGINLEASEGYINEKHCLKSSREKVSLNLNPEEKSVLKSNLAEKISLNPNCILTTTDLENIPQDELYNYINIKTPREKEFEERRDKLRKQVNDCVQQIRTFKMNVTAELLLKKESIKRENELTAMKRRNKQKINPFYYKAGSLKNTHQIGMEVVSEDSEDEVSDDNQEGLFVAIAEFGRNELMKVMKF